MRKRPHTLTPAGPRRDRRSPWPALTLGLWLLLALVYPILDVTLRWGQLDRVAQILILVLLALGLNIVVGMAGLLDLGYAAFFAIGAYTVAFLTSPVSPLPFRTDFWTALAVSWVVAAIFGILLGAPTLRLRGDYLAVVTLAFGEIVPRVFLNVEAFTGGSKGMNPIERPFLPGVEFGVTPVLGSVVVPWYYLCLAVALLSIIMVARLARSRLGRAWVALREDELAAASLGIDRARTKLSAFALGASFSGFGGCLFAGMLQVVSPSQFDFSISVMVLAMVVLGGTGHLGGVLAGAFVVGAFDRVLAAELTNWTRHLGAGLGMPLLQQVDFSNARLLVFGLALVTVMVLRPQGLFVRSQRLPAPEPEVSPPQPAVSQSPSSQ